MNVEEFEDFAASGYNRIPVYRPVNLDVPFDDLIKILIKPNSALLQFHDDNGHQISIFALSTTEVITYHHRQITVKKGKSIKKQFEIDTIPPINPLEWLSDYNSYLKTPRIDELPSFMGGMIGHIGNSLTEFTHLKADAFPSNELPDFAFMLCDDFLIIDHDTEQVWIVIYTDPIISHAYEKAYAKLTQLVDDINFTLNDTQHNNPESFLIGDFDINEALQFAKNQNDAHLILPLMQEKIQNRFSILSHLFPHVKHPAYFIHFEDYYLFGFGRNSLKKFKQNITMSFKPNTWPALPIADNWYNYSKITSQKNLSTVCLKEDFHTDKHQIHCLLPPEFSAIDVIKATMPHPLQFKASSCYVNPIQQGGMIGMLNWHNDFIGQFIFYSWLMYKESLYFTKPLFIEKDIEKIRIESSIKKVVEQLNTYG